MEKILLVEDNEMNRDMLSRRLERKGYQVICALDGEQAVAMASDAQKSKEVGCDDYDTKPVELARLLAKMEALLRKSSNPAGATPPMQKPQNLSSGDVSRPL